MKMVLEVGEHERFKITLSCRVGYEKDFSKTFEDAKIPKISRFSTLDRNPAVGRYRTEIFLLIDSPQKLEIDVPEGIKVEIEHVSPESSATK